MTVYADHPGGGAQITDSKVFVLNTVGERVGVEVPVGVEIGVLVGVSVWIGWWDGVEISTLSRVGYAAIEDVCPPSVNASSMLPRTIAIDNPAARKPRKTLLKPNNPSFTKFNLSLVSG